MFTKYRFQPPVETGNLPSDFAQFRKATVDYLLALEGKGVLRIDQESVFYERPPGLTGYAVPANTNIWGGGRYQQVYLAGAVNGLGISGANVRINGLYINGPSAVQLLYASASAANVMLRDLDLYTSPTAAANGLGIQVNAASCNKWSITGSYIDTYSFSLIVNNTAGGSKGFIIGFNFSQSDTADPLNINSWGTSVEDAVIVGNVTKVTNVTAGSGTDAGFGGVALAHANGVSVIGNISQRSYNESDHIEDGCKNVTMIGNVRKVCLGDGLRLTADATAITGNISYAQTKTLQIIGNVYEGGAYAMTSGAEPTAPAKVAGSAGIRILYAGGYTGKNNVIIGNVVRNFATGIHCGGLAEQLVDGNVIDNCTYAISSEVASRITGTNHVLGVCSALLLITGSPGFSVQAGKFVCDTKPTLIIDKSASASRPGHSVKGFSWPQSETHAGGSGTEWKTLFAVGTRFDGRVVINAFNTANQADAIWFSANVNYDGTTLAVLAPIEEQSGGLGLTAAPYVRVNAGNFQIGLTHASAINIALRMEFDGIYMS